MRTSDETGMGEELELSREQFDLLDAMLEACHGREPGGFYRGVCVGLIENMKRAQLPDVSAESIFEAWRKKRETRHGAGDNLAYLV
jgi:hypothetical protein